jgi:hypothetical protein
MRYQHRRDKVDSASQLYAIRQAGKSCLTSREVPEFNPEQFGAQMKAVVA